MVTRSLCPGLGKCLLRRGAVPSSRVGSRFSAERSATWFGRGFLTAKQLITVFWKIWGIRSDKEAGLCCADVGVSAGTDGSLLTPLGADVLQGAAPVGFGPRCRTGGFGSNRQGAAAARSKPCSAANARAEPLDGKQQRAALLFLGLLRETE